MAISYFYIEEPLLGERLPDIVVYGQDKSYIEMVRYENPQAWIEWRPEGEKPMVFSPLQAGEIPRITVPLTLLEPQTIFVATKEEAITPPKKFPWWILLLLAGGIGLAVWKRKK